MKIKRRRPINTAAKSDLNSSFLGEGESCLRAVAVSVAEVWWLQTQNAGQGRTSLLLCCLLFFLVCFSVEHNSKAHLYCCSPQNKTGF